jgi:hypothetical protein
LRPSKSISSFIFVPSLLAQLSGDCSAFFVVHYSCSFFLSQGTVLSVAGSTLKMHSHRPDGILTSISEDSGTHREEKCLNLHLEASDPSHLDLPSRSRSYPTGWRLAAILFSLICGTLLVALDNTIIGVAVPEITTDFKALNDVGWYASAYLITVTALQPTYGNIYKYFPVKRTYLISILIFEGNCKSPTPS